MSTDCPGTNAVNKHSYLLLLCRLKSSTRQQERWRLWGRQGTLWSEVTLWWRATGGKRTKLKRASLRTAGTEPGEGAICKYSLTNDADTEKGWVVFFCRDSGSLDAYGYLQIKGRIKDMIIRGGENIYPTEIEKTLDTHPKVKEAQVSSGAWWAFNTRMFACRIEDAFSCCQVVGVEDFRLGEEICAFIQLGDRQDCTVQEIRDYCRGKVRLELSHHISACHMHSSAAAALLLSDRQLQNSPLRPLCRQFPHHVFWEGTFI